MKQMNNRGLLIVYSGPSGVGKGTILAPLTEKGGPLTLSVSVTTRRPRQGEISGIHYHFITADEFEGMIKSSQMLEYAKYGDNYYGTPGAFVENELNEGRDVILEIETQGAKRIKELMPEAITVFVVPPSFAELKKRLEGRSTETDEDVKNRLETAVEELEFAKDYDFIIVNDNVETARQRLLEIVAAGRYMARSNKKLLDEVLTDAQTVIE